MDIISHGLWGGGLFGENSKKIFWTAFFFGIFPDFVAFSFPFSARIISALSGNGVGFGYDAGRPAFPDYVHDIYTVSHSLVIFSLVFLIVWIIRKKPYIPILAWGFHVFLDIFTHTKEFFPTPFLWPISNYKFDGVSWGTPVIFFTNLVFLAVLFTVLIIQRRKKKIWPM